MTHVVAEPCFACKYTDCVVVCPVECFYEGEKMLYIHPDECIDCEACVPECPVEAIFHEDNLPEEWKEFTALNAEMAPQCPVITEKKEPLAGGIIPRRTQPNGRRPASQSAKPVTHLAFALDEKIPQALQSPDPRRRGIFIARTVIVAQRGPVGSGALAVRARSSTSSSRYRQECLWRSRRGCRATRP